MESIISAILAGAVTLIGVLTANGNNLVLNVSEGKIRPIFNLYSATSAENVFTIHLEGSERINRETAVGDIGAYKEKET